MMREFYTEESCWNFFFISEIGQSQISFLFSVKSPTCDDDHRYEAKNGTINEERK